ncbi:MAG: BrnA antitoxin family protein [Chloroflexota bacterium]|nr:BrnA antitoxin family protein [Chloroflexota bacterium]
MSQPQPTVDLGYPTEAHGRIPAFNSIEEEAAFWDTHDFTDFAEESRPVEVSVGQELAARLTLRLDKADRELLAKQARAKGIGPSTLARMWLKERLRQEAQAETPAP